MRKTEREIVRKTEREKYREREREREKTIKYLNADFCWSAIVSNTTPPTAAATGNHLT